MIASVGFVILGSSRSSKRTSRGAYRTAPRMLSPFSSVTSRARSSPSWHQGYRKLRRRDRYPWCHEGDDRAREVTLEKGDRKSTRLNSSHVKSSYAVFCLKKKKK